AAELDGPPLGGEGLPGFAEAQDRPALVRERRRLAAAVFLLPRGGEGRLELLQRLHQLALQGQREADVVLDGGLSLRQVEPVEEAERLLKQIQGRRQVAFLPGDGREAAESPGFLR